ncbi:MAG: sodium transporter, partial [Bacteroidota bacterium]
VACMLVNTLVSRSTPPPSEEQIANYTWNTSLIKEETEELAGLPWYKNYRVLSVFLLILTLLLVGWFW